jgi:hypothetical protein
LQRLVKVPSGMHPAPDFDQTAPFFKEGVVDRIVNAG